MTAEVHLVAGLNGAGKSTVARRLEQNLPAVRFSLDEWMLRLHGLGYDDPAYPARADACRELIWDLSGQVLRAGASVVLDWNFWSRDRRADAVRRSDDLGAVCHLHFVDVPLEVAVARATQRTDARSHPLQAAAVRHLATLFEAPEASEGFVLHPISSDGSQG